MVASGGGGGGGKERGGREDTLGRGKLPDEKGEELVSSAASGVSWLLLLLRGRTASCLACKLGLPEAEPPWLPPAAACSWLLGIWTGAPVEADRLWAGGTTGGGILGRSLWWLTDPGSDETRSGGLGRSGLSAGSVCCLSSSVPDLSSVSSMTEAVCLGQVLYWLSGLRLAVTATEWGRSGGGGAGFRATRRWTELDWWRSSLNKT